MIIFDYLNHVVNYNNKSFPFKIVIEKTENGNDEHIVSIVALQSELFDKERQYISNTAKWIDEHITYFVETEDGLKLSDKEIMEEIYG